MQEEEEKWWQLQKDHAESFDCQLVILGMDRVRASPAWNP